MSNIVNFDDTVELLKSLIEIKSPYFEEDEIMDFVSKWLDENKIPNSIQEYTEDKITGFTGKNVISVLEGGKEGPVVYFNGHLDTVQICNGWQRDPVKATVEGDKIYGVGALDMKSGCAAIMNALRAFKENHESFSGKIITSFVSDEEGPFGLGSDAVITSGITDHVDISIVTEPSSGFTKAPFPCMCLGARGGYGMVLEFFGKSAHAANPEEGVNAAVEAGKMISKLDTIDFVEDPYLGKGCVCVVSIESDGGACSVPDYAKVQLFRHIVPGETKQTIIDEMEKVSKLAGVNCEYKISFRDAPSEGTEAFLPYTVSESNKYIKTLNEVCKDVTGKDASVSYFQSIGDFNYLGTRIDAPCVIFGTEGENYHSADEYTTISSLTQTTAILYNFLEELLVK